MLVEAIQLYRNEMTKNVPQKEEMSLFNYHKLIAEIVMENIRRSLGPAHKDVFFLPSIVVSGYSKNTEVLSALICKLKSQIFTYIITYGNSEWSLARKVILLIQGVSSIAVWDIMSCRSIGCSPETNVYDSV